MESSFGTILRIFFLSHEQFIQGSRIPQLVLQLASESPPSAPLDEGTQFDQNNQL